MNSRSKKLGEIADIKQGRYLAKEDMAEVRSAEHPVPVHGANGIIGWTDRAMYETGVPLVTCRGSNSGMVLWASGPLWVSNNAMAIIPRDGDLRFAYYCLLNAPPYETVSGSAQPQITRTALSPKLVFWPGTDEQRAISDALSAFDDKIELNRRMNDTLEAMAEAIFRDWFVDFGPVRRKLAGETDPVVILGNLIPDHVRATELAALFPDSFDERALPVGWSEEPVIDQANWVNGAAYKKMHFVLPGEGLPVIKIAELKAGVTANTGFTNTDLGSRYRIDDGELLFSWSGNPDTSIDTFIWTGGPAWLNQHIFAVRPNGSRTLGFLFAMLKHLNPAFAEIARDKQTTGLGHVTKEDLKRLRQAVPNKPVEIAFDALMTPIFCKLRSGQTENRILAETRDYLLPRLMSGAVLAGDIGLAV